VRKAALLYNPLSGRRSSRRLADMRAALAVLRNAGIEVSAAPTQAANDAAEQVREAVSQECDTVFACGGDGTIHDVVQGLVGTEVALGVIPLGTANAVAHDLGIPLGPARAARVALSARARRVAVGQVTYQNPSGNSGCCYFLAAAGMGVDAHVFHELDSSLKTRFGMLAYYARAGWLWLTHNMQTFNARFVEPAGSSRQIEISELLAVRIRNFGGVVRELAPGASLDRNDLRLVLFRTQSRVRYLQYILRGVAGAGWKVSGVELESSAEVSCRDLPGAKSLVYVEADGEVLGTLPAELRIVPAALTVLFPNPGRG